MERTDENAQIIKLLTEILTELKRSADAAEALNIKA